MARAGGHSTNKEIPVGFVLEIGFVCTCVNVEVLYLCKCLRTKN